MPRYSSSLWKARHDSVKARVSIIVLSREIDADALACTIRSFDHAYNGVRRYPYLVMSETAWSERAKASLQRETEARVDFVEIPARSWALPGVTHRDAAAPPRYYGDTDAYRKMCRFFSGPVFKLQELADFDYFWRLDAHVRYLCDVATADDPVAALVREGGVFAFSIVMQEQMATVPGLWDTAEKFAASRNATNELHAWSRSGGTWAKGCHFWSNMEVGSLDFFRGDAYQSWFSAADAAGGFANERWGDAPVQTLGLMMLAPRKAVRYLPEMGYQHPPNFRCPRSGVCRSRGVEVECKGDLFAGCTRNIGDGLAHIEGCQIDEMLA